MFFNFLKFCSLFYGIGVNAKNSLYDKGFIKPKKVDAYVISDNGILFFTTKGLPFFVAEICYNKGKRPIKAGAIWRNHIIRK